MYTFETLTNYLDTLYDKEKVPGFDCAVIHNGKEVYKHYGGFKDRENNIPMSGKDLFMIYSASKVITVAAALRALEEGRFLLNHPLWWYLEEFKDMSVKDVDENGKEIIRPAKEQIYIHDLFTMTAGLNYDLYSKQILEVKRKNPKSPTREIVRAIAKTPLDFEPNTRWQYSLCHDVLACLVEVVTGERFCDYVDRVIFKPLGMEAYYHATPEIENRIVNQYVYNFDTNESELVEKKNEHVLGEEFDSGGAGVITSVDDYAKFAYALANYGVGANGYRVLSKASVNLMRANTLPIGSQMSKDFDNWLTNTGYSYGYGVRTNVREGRGINLCSAGEFGWDGACGFLCSIDPEKNLAIIYGQQRLVHRNERTHNKIKNIVNSIIE